MEIIMDTGPVPNILLRNIETMGVDLWKTEAVLISHAHYDHSGGLIETLKSIGKKIQ